jgi:hypothetical protein
MDVAFGGVIGGGATKRAISPVCDVWTVCGSDLWQDLKIDLSLREGLVFERTFLLRVIKLDSKSCELAMPSFSAGTWLPLTRSNRKA